MLYISPLEGAKIQDFNLNGVIQLGPRGTFPSVQHLLLVSEEKGLFKLLRLDVSTEISASEFSIISALFLFGHSGEFLASYLKFIICSSAICSVKILAGVKKYIN